MIERGSVSELGLGSLEAVGGCVGSAIKPRACRKEHNRGYEIAKVWLRKVRPKGWQRWAVMQAGCHAGCQEQVVMQVVQVQKWAVCACPVQSGDARASQTGGRKKTRISPHSQKSRCCC